MTRKRGVNGLRWKWMGRVLTVTYVFLLLGIQLFADIFSERDLKPVSADAEQTEEIRPRIALTFDDGPSAAYTGKLLEGLRERGVQATFFLIGENIEKEDNALLVRQMAREGHLIGNHTYHHVQLTKIKEEEAIRELEKTNQLIEKITGNPVEYVRPPYGELPGKLSEKISMIPVMWTVDPLDWSVKDTEKIVRKVVTQTKENDMILLHDCYETSVEAALQIIDRLQEKGFEFVTADRLLLP